MHWAVTTIAHFNVMTHNPLPATINLGQQRRMDIQTLIGAFDAHDRIGKFDRKGWPLLKAKVAWTAEAGYL